MVDPRHNGNHWRAIELWMAGHSYEEIAALLGVEASTVKTYIERTRRSYSLWHGIESRADLWAALRASRRPLATPPEPQPTETRTQ